MRACVSIFVWHEVQLHELTNACLPLWTLHKRLYSQQPRTMYINRSHSEYLFFFHLLALLPPPHPLSDIAWLR